MSIAEFPIRHDDDNQAASRMPPQDLIAEASVLGAMMLSKDAIADALETVRGEDFYRPAHQSIFTSIVNLFARNEPADPITVTAELQRLGEASRVGGAAYLHELVQSVPTAANAEYYGRIVSERATQRRLVEAGNRITTMGYAGDGDIDDVVDRAQAEVFKVAQRRAAEDYQPLSVLIPEALAELEMLTQRGGAPTGVPTGFAELDDLTRGLHGGQMIVVAARPAMGKSTFALDLARSAAIKHKRPTVFFSLEMSRSEILMRLLSAGTEIRLNNLRAGQVGQPEWDKLARHMAEASESPMFIDDSPNLTMMEIRAKARRLKQQHGLDLVIIDYLQLMSSGKRVESRQVEVSEFSRQMKLLAKELDVPVVALSQLNRGPEQRSDKKPMMSDLRESGSIEQDADVVILLHREDVYNPESPRVGEADLNVAKHRNGPTKTIGVAFQGHYSRFTDLGRGYA